jgi:exopolysaccharide biosynthesis polyprenyl glycosylphosphotransferase
MLKERRKAFEGLARAVDLGVIAAAFAGAASTCERLSGVEPLASMPGWSASGGSAAAYQYALFLLISLLGWLTVTQWRSSYRSHRVERPWPTFRSHMATQLMWAMLAGLSAFLLKLPILSRTFFLIFLPLSMILLSVRIAATKFMLRFLRARGFNLRTVVVVGDAERASRLAEFISRESSAGYRVVSLIRGIDAANGKPFTQKFDEAFLLTGDGVPDPELLALKLIKQGKRVHLVPGIFDATLFRQEMGNFAGIPVLSIGGYGLSDLETAAKRFLDVAASILLLTILAPAMALVALMIKLSSRGPVLFAQERLGAGRRRFRMYKFRTMRKDAEETLLADADLYQAYVANTYKLPKGKDPRITPLGKFLRKTSVDELPQLLNVLKGDMSLVGPRPIVPREIEKYGDYASLFLSVKPGLTGYWQIQGRSEITDYTRRAELDIEYIRDQSLRNDVDILLRTVPAVLRRKGAY